MISSVRCFFDQMFPQEHTKRYLPDNPVIKIEGRSKYCPVLEQRVFINGVIVYQMRYMHTMDLGYVSLAYVKFRRLTIAFEGCSLRS